MPRPKEGYYLDGERVPGVTTITGQLDWGKSGRLIWWAKKETLEGRDPMQSRDKAANAGTVAHALIEAHLLKRPPELEPNTPKEIIEKGETAFLNFLTWAEGFKLNPRSVEEAMVSRKYRCGTTPDLIAYVQNRLSIVDWKTGGAYATSYIELAARKPIWEEIYPDEPITGGFHLLKFNRETGAFDHHYREGLPECFDAFLCLRKLYDCKKNLEKLV